MEQVSPGNTPPPWKLNKHPHYEVRALSIYDAEGSLEWETHVDLPQQSGSREAAVLIQLDVDGQFDVVQADIGGMGDRSTLGRACVALQRVLAALDELYPENWAPVGNCWMQGDWGRCYGSEGHSGEHNFPKPPLAYRQAVAKGVAS